MHMWRALKMCNKSNMENFSEGELLPADAKKLWFKVFTKSTKYWTQLCLVIFSLFQCVCIWKSEFERIYCRGRVGANEIWNGKWGKFETENGEQSKIYKKGTNITYLPLPPFKIKSNCNLWILSDSRRLPAPVWHNMYITSKTLNLQFC